jgi:hypothetical protein
MVFLSGGIAVQVIDAYFKYNLQELSPIPPGLHFSPLFS